MLDSRRNKGPDPSKSVSLIGPDTKIGGEILSQGTLRIEGTVEGRIQAGVRIDILESGRVKADMTSGEIVISGEVHGNVFAHDRLEITETGKVFGDITAPRISIAEGVLVEGKFTMRPPGEAQPPQRPQGGQQAQAAGKPQPQEAKKG